MRTSNLPLKDFAAEVNKSLAYAERLISNRDQYVFIRHDGCYTCDFAGHLLVTMFTRTYKERVEPVIYIQDGDDFNMEMTFKTEEAALRVYNELFMNEPIFDSEFVATLRRYGFV